MKLGITAKTITLTFFISTSFFADSVGKPCETDANCGENGSCLVEKTDGAGNRAVRDGYCTIFNCDEENTCTEGSECTLLENINVFSCLKTCQQDSECRIGYKCLDDSVCFPK